MSEPAIRLEGLRLAWPFAARPVLDGIDLAIAPGERFLLLGPSGSGKSSLALTLNGLAPRSIRAAVGGRVATGGLDPVHVPVAGFASTLSYLFQDSDSQFCALTVEDELAFGLENRGAPPAEIEARIDAAMAAVGLPPRFRGRVLATLSGGEKQKVALATLVADDNPILVLDEATAQLDPRATTDTYALLNRLAAERRKTLLFVDHKLDDLVGIIDRVGFLTRDGRLARVAPPAALFHDHHADLVEAGIWRPLAADIAQGLRAARLDFPAKPLTMPALLAALDAAAAAEPRLPAVLRALVEPPRRPSTAGAPLVRLRGIGWAPPRHAPILRGIDMDIRAGEILGLVGGNGAGKSTLGLIIAGRLAPTAGSREAPGPGAVVFQNPEHQFVAATLRGELTASLPGDPEATARADAILAAWGLSHAADEHPFKLSQGQKRRLAVTAMTLGPPPPVLVLDEPTHGLDAAGAARIAEEIAAMRHPDRALVVVTHDMDLAERLCDRLAVMADGAVLAVGAPEAIFADTAILARAGLRPPAAWPLREWAARHG